MSLSLNKNKIILGLIIALCLSTLLIYLLNIPVLTFNSHGELSESFSTVDELKQKAEVIVEVNISDAKAEKYNEVVFTLSNAEVKKIYKGELQNKTSINILETGGVHNHIEHTFEGEKTLKKQDTAILFLKKYNGPVTKEAYVILGMYQGKFKLDKSGTVIGKNKELPTGLNAITNKHNLNLE
ncbi:hypothetical protein HZF08_12545 [Paenibacillus sp. CGMCC 1.16610]|uniref:Uncharacterized protein n=1 Tax=Paenibacillus anseongense TaxID=2682845 RepID=A0ABW9U9M5_9BACL|nr:MULTISPECIES: hypothetical protein [Paenibacillus]MBA2939136.1 hypothetical protein [Paenibacillus sp. CGMCC 1.16610]MVQ35095.1 hypothetical protein [Paenibacillus anseongense]